MTEAERKKRPCAACGNRVGPATIVTRRDGWGSGPFVPLCMTCGTRRGCEEVWAMIWKRRLATDPDATIIVDVPHIGIRAEVESE